MAAARHLLQPHRGEPRLDRPRTGAVLQQVLLSDHQGEPLRDSRQAIGRLRVCGEVAEGTRPELGPRVPVDHGRQPGPHLLAGVDPGEDRGRGRHPQLGHVRARAARVVELGQLAVAPLDPVAVGHAGQGRRGEGPAAGEVRMAGGELDREHRPEREGDHVVQVLAARVVGDQVRHLRHRLSRTGVAGAAVCGQVDADVRAAGQQVPQRLPHLAAHGVAVQPQHALRPVARAAAVDGQAVPGLRGTHRGALSRLPGTADRTRGR